jgi:hypothetical protein
MKILTIIRKRDIVLTILIATLSLFQSCGTTYNVRRTVTDATKSARKLIDSPSDKRILDFNEKYALAKADMQRLLNEAQYNPLAYGVIADNGVEWITLGNLLRSLEANRIQGAQHVLVVEATDYTSIVADSRQKACDAYFDEGVKIIQISSDFQRRKSALTYFDKSLKYSTKYADDIAYYGCLVYVEEADRILHSGHPSSQRLQTARGYYNEALRLSVNDPEQQQIIRDKIATVDVVYVNTLIEEADRQVRVGSPQSIDLAIANYNRAAEMGSREAAIKKQDLLRRVGIVVVISGERVSSRFLANLQSRLPNYVEVRMHSPLLGSRYEGDILIVTDRNWGRRDMNGDINLSFEIVDLRRGGITPHKLADFTYKAKRKEQFETVLDRNRNKIIEIIRNLGLNGPYSNRGF